VSPRGVGLMVCPLPRKGTAGQRPDELLKCTAVLIRTKSAKVGDGRPALSRAPGGRSAKRPSLLRPSKAAKARLKRVPGELRKRSSLHRRGKAAKAGAPQGADKTADVPEAPYV